MDKLFGYEYDKDSLFTNSLQVYLNEIKWIDDNLSNIKYINYSVFDDVQSQFLFHELYGYSDYIVDKIPEEIRYNSLITVDAEGDDTNIATYHVLPCFLCRASEFLNGEVQNKILSCSSNPFSIINYLLVYFIREKQRLFIESQKNESTVVENTKPKYQSRMNIFSRRK